MRTRFPPSPTGFLHVGGLRTALYNYLLARQTNGKFLLRIEDTDQERGVPGAVENILESLHWAGLDPNEGVVLERGTVAQTGAHGPYFQSQRLDLYRKYAQELIGKEHAYYCFCTPSRLEEMRRSQEARKQAPMYDRHCLSLPADEVKKKLADGMPHVVRMKVPHERVIRFADDIRGPLSFHAHTVDDQVLLKSDGFPTYHLAHVVDDHLMEIDLVMRGEEWLSSLPKHLLLFEFLGWTPPRYAHVPLLLNADRTKLSKRQNAVSVQEYIAKGYLPEAMLNFLALLGWNPGTTQEIFSLDELIQQFSLERVQKAGAVFDLEKLDWLQGQWMRKIPLQEFTQRIRPVIGEKYPEALKDDELEMKANLIQERITFFREAPEMLSFFYRAPHVTVELMANPKQKVKAEDLRAILDALTALLSVIPDDEWTNENLFASAKKLVAKGSWKLGQLLWPLRAALTGLPFSPGATEVAVALGKEETLKRLANAQKITA